MNIAVIGLGSIGLRHVANFLALGCRVKAWDLAPAARAACRKTGVATIDEALDGADGVVIATPPDTHADLALPLSARNVWLMIEKPMAVDAEDGKFLRAHPRLLVAYPWRHWPALQAVKALLDAGRLGRILSVSTTYGYHLNVHGPHASNPESFMRDLSRGGGCLLDTSHAIDYVRWLCGEITHVSGVVETRALDMQADDSADLMVRFASVAVGTLRLSLCLPEVTSTLEIIGERGRLTWDRTTSRVRIEGETPHEEVFGGHLNDMYVNEARHFMACIRGEETPVCDGWDGLTTLKVVDAARRASEEQRWVSV